MSWWKTDWWNKKNKDLSREEIAEIEKKANEGDREARKRLEEILKS